MMFQSARPRGTRSRQSRRTAVGETRFNPRVRGGRDALLSVCSDRRRCFNPRVRGGRDHSTASSAVNQVSVSIRASAGDAIFFGMTDAQSKTLFQSARPRGTRYLRQFTASTPFQVSIRASAGDAISPTITQAHSITPFQSARPRGTRSIAITDAIEAASVSIRASAGDAMPNPTRQTVDRTFQSARPRGTRYPWRLPIDQSHPRFNPRVRGGRDKTMEQIHQHHRVSIRASAGDAIVNSKFGRPCGMFQSARPRGTRFRCTPVRTARTCFNPRVRGGRDRICGSFDVGESCVYKIANVRPATNLCANVRMHRRRKFCWNQGLRQSRTSQDFRARLGSALEVISGGVDYAIKGSSTSQLGLAP